MNNLRWIAVAILPALSWGCFTNPRRIDYGTFVRSGEPPPLRERAATAEVAGRDERALEHEARLEPMLRIALLRNAEVLELRARVHEAVDRVPAAGRLPDMELKYEQWGVPLNKPYALDHAEAVMLGVRQAFPAPGSLDAEERAAAEGARVALYSLRAKELDVMAQVRRGYYQYYLADREYQLHLEHVALTQRTLELARTGFGAGAGSQQDLLRMELELRGLNRDLVTIARRKRSSAVLLNALMGRLSDSPLGPTPLLEPVELHGTLEELEKIAEQRRPELIAAHHTIQRSGAAVDRAHSEADWPRFMVGVDYMYMPFMEEPHGYGAMASISLPWINGRHDDEIRAAERARVASERGADAVRIAVRFEVRDAFARNKAARESYRIVRDDLLQAAERSFDAAQSAFATGRGSGVAVLESLRSLLLLRLDETRALVELLSSIADLERAVGTEIEESTFTRGPRT